MHLMELMKLYTHRHTHTHKYPKTYMQFSRKRDGLQKQKTTVGQQHNPQPPLLAVYPHTPILTLPNGGGQSRFPPKHQLPRESRTFSFTQHSDPPRKRQRSSAKASSPPPQALRALCPVPAPHHSHPYALAYGTMPSTQQTYRTLQPALHLHTSRGQARPSDGSSQTGTHLLAEPAGSTVHPPPCTLLH